MTLMTTMMMMMMMVIITVIIIKRTTMTKTKMTITIMRDVTVEPPPPNDKEDENVDNMMCAAPWQRLPAGLVVRDAVGGPLHSSPLAVTQDGRHGQQGGATHTHD